VGLGCDASFEARWEVWNKTVIGASSIAFGP
jgi:hypothetical protein